MRSFQLLAVGLLASFSSATPVAEIVDRAGSMNVRRDNCTSYSSVAAGTVCVHLPSDCTAKYLVESGDTCQAIGTKFGNFTLSQLYYWNPDIGQTCGGLRAYVPVCINTPWYIFTPPVQAATGAVVNADAVPVPIMSGIVTTCKKFEFVGSGLRVDAIVAQNNITMAQFLEWNKAVDQNSPTVWAQYWVCVDA